MAEEQKHQHHKMDEDEEPVAKTRSTKKTKCTIKSFAKSTEICTLCFGLQQRATIWILHCVQVRFLDFKWWQKQ